MVIREPARKYSLSHPFLTFLLDTSKFDHRIWLLLGEAKSKCEHIIGSPLLPEVKDYMMRVFMAKGASSTTAIEGNTLTEEEVLKRIAGDLELPPSKEYLGTEIDNVIAAYDLIAGEQVGRSPGKLTVKDIAIYNERVLKGLPIEEGVIPGKFRDYPVGVGRYQGAPAEDCEYLLERYVNWLGDEFKPPKGDEMIYGILKAIVAHLYFEWIHPFGDGNGRTGRLIEFRLLLEVGVPATSAHLLSNHYNQTRSQYYRQLERTSQPHGDVSQFVTYALQGFVDQLSSQIQMIRNSQLYAHWVNHIHKSFEGKNKSADIRRKKLLLALSVKSKDNPAFILPIKKIRHITPEIAEIYATLKERTDYRDVEKLVDMGFLEKTKEGVRLKWELLSAFLPAIRTQE